MDELQALAQYHTMVESGMPLNMDPPDSAIAAEPLPGGVTTLMCPGYMQPPPRTPTPTPTVRPSRDTRAEETRIVTYNMYIRPPTFEMLDSPAVDNGIDISEAMSHLNDRTLLIPHSWTHCSYSSFSRANTPRYQRLIKSSDPGFLQTSSNPFYPTRFESEFESIDCDGDMLISPDEAARWGVSNGNFSLLVDTDGDGYVRKYQNNSVHTEWDALVSVIEAQLFAWYDKNGNGFIDKVVVGPASRSKFETAYLLAYEDFPVDTSSCGSGNPAISFWQAQQHWQNNWLWNGEIPTSTDLQLFFSALDTNENGCIDQGSEFASAFGYSSVGPIPTKQVLDLPEGWGDDQVYTW